MHKVIQYVLFDTVPIKCNTALLFRLVSEKTVEENILRKAQQKRILGEIAIEEGGFTSDFFRQSSIRDIFNLSAEAAAGQPLADDALALSQLDLEQVKIYNM